MSPRQAKSGKPPILLPWAHRHAWRVSDRRARVRATPRSSVCHLDEPPRDAEVVSAGPSGSFSDEDNIF
jgi:hypothetical protein